MTHSEAPISITVKTAAGSLVTVRAESGEELDQVVANGLAAIISATQELETGIRGANQSVTANLAASLGAQVIDTQYHAPEVPQSAPLVGSITGARGCAHGKMTAIQGLGKDGKPYKGYFCPAPKGAFDKCKNQYVKVTDLEWNTFVPDQVK
jgi:hypothetical protein